MLSKRGPAPPCGSSASLQVQFYYPTQSVMEHTTPYQTHNTSHRCGRDAALTWRRALATGKYYCRHGNPWTDEEEMSKTEGGKWTLRNEGEETMNNRGNENCDTILSGLCLLMRAENKNHEKGRRRLWAMFGAATVLFKLPFCCLFFTESCPWCVTCLMRDKVGQPFPAGHFSNKLSSLPQRWWKTNKARHRLHVSSRNKHSSSAHLSVTFVKLCY